MQIAVCSVFSPAFLFLALVLGGDQLPQQCPVADPGAMISIQHDTGDGSLSLRSSTPRPVLREGELLVKASPNHLQIQWNCSIRTSLNRILHAFQPLTSFCPIGAD